MSVVDLRVVVATILVVGFLAVGSLPGARAIVRPFTGVDVVCAVTTPNGQRVPTATLPDSPYWHGADGLSTVLWPEGAVVFRRGGPGAVLRDGSLRMKFIWFKPKAPLSIEGRRLDAEAPPLRSVVDRQFDGADYQPSDLIFPTPGCWQVTARAGAATLTFVTRVIKIGSGPRSRG